MASITVVSASTTDLHLNSSSGIITSSPSSNGGNSPTTYLLLTTSSDAKPVVSKATAGTIAPKRSNSGHHHLSSNSGSPTVLRAKRKIQFAAGVDRHPAPPAVARRNERERNRVRQVNLGFATLRQHVPNGTKSKKMSKVETLRSAVQYIKQLQQLLDETGHSDSVDENSMPAFDDVAHLSAHQHRPHQHSIHHHHQNGQMNENRGSVGLVGVTSPPYSAASSPTPSLGSEASSPYGSLSQEDEDLLDFTTWLS